MLRSRQSESVVASLCKSALDQQSLILEEQLAIRESKERDRHEKLISVMTQAVNNLVTTKFEEIMSNEIKDIILPGDITPPKFRIFLKNTLHKSVRIVKNIFCRIAW